MFHFSPVYWYVLLCVLFFGHMAETHSPIVIRRDGSIWRKPSLFPAFIQVHAVICLRGRMYGLCIGVSSLMEVGIKSDQTDPCRRCDQFHVHGTDERIQFRHRLDIQRCCKHCQCQYHAENMGRFQTARLLCCYRTYPLTSCYKILQSSEP